MACGMADGPERTPEQESEIPRIASDLQRIASELFERRMARLRLAIQLGETALLRLRAECLLERADAGEIPMTEAERDELDRIAVAPVEHDRAFLTGFNDRLEDDP
jgi:hypothetical protein